MAGVKCAEQVACVRMENNVPGMTKVATDDHMVSHVAADQTAYFGRRVRSFRKARGLTQEDLAMVLGAQHQVFLHQTTVAKLESGNRPTNVPELFALASALGVSYEELLPPIVVAHPSGDVPAAKTAFERAQSISKVRAKDADKAHDQAARSQLEADAAEAEAKALEAKYVAALRHEDVRRLRAQRLRELAADMEGESSDGER